MSKNSQVLAVHFAVIRAHCFRFATGPLVAPSQEAYAPFLHRAPAVAAASRTCCVVAVHVPLATRRLDEALTCLREDLAPLFSGCDGDGGGGGGGGGGGDCGEPEQARGEDWSSTEQSLLLRPPLCCL